jgi:Ca2+-binding EF-hand superfamily protein
MSQSNELEENASALYAEEFGKPWYFHNASVANLQQQLANAPTRAVAVRNGDKWPVSGATDINRLKLECSALQDASGSIVQFVIVKERKQRVAELPAPKPKAEQGLRKHLKKALGANEDTSSAASSTGGEEVVDGESIDPTRAFVYFLESSPKDRFDSVERVLDAAGYKPLMAHHWVATAFRRPTTCVLCHKFIWGIAGKNGHQCRVCQKAAHSRCYTMIPPRCAGVAMTKAERQELAVRKVWSTIDGDGNGSVTFSELVNRMGMSADEATLFIKAFDKDRNSQIDYHEFSTMIRKYFLNSFRQFDKDDDGEITPKELKEGFKELGMNLTATELHKYMSEMDADDDGVITLDEYVEACFITIALKAAEEELQRPTP